MTVASPTTDGIHPSDAEVLAVARGMATAVAPASGITQVQAALLRALTRAVTGIDVDYCTLEPLGSEELAHELADRPLPYRHRIVHHMVLAELVLAPLPADVAARVCEYAAALGIADDFIRVARRYAEGALGLAWIDLRRSGFLDHWDDRDSEPLHTKAALSHPFESAPADPELTARWMAFGELPVGTLGRSVHEMYLARGFQFPGLPGSASAYLAQHDFIHVVADYGTTLEGELEVFGFLGRADPDPKGFAWLATMIGLFETGHVFSQGPFEMDVREHHLRTAGMDVRLADAIRRGKLVCESYGRDLFEIDYHELADQPVEQVREMLRVPPKSREAQLGGSVGVFDEGGMSEFQRVAGLRHASDRA